MDENYILSIIPGFPKFINPITNYVERINNDSHMTIYIFNNKTTALLSKKMFENEGYKTHLINPDGSIHI
jgi:hypothetical protein